MAAEKINPNFQKNHFRRRLPPDCAGVKPWRNALSHPAFSGL
jgi:hypothetical protein